MSSPKYKAPPSKVLFLDLETTGLHPKFCSILEVAAVAVDSSTKELASFQAVIFHPRERILPEMDAWCTNTHTQSGLLSDVEHSPLTLEQVDEQLAMFVERHLGDSKPVELAGNSVHFDLEFIRYHMPRTAALLSHRTQDVSGAARMVRRFMNLHVPTPPTDVTHRAMEDVRWSIEQLRLLRLALKGGRNAIAS